MIIVIVIIIIIITIIITIFIVVVIIIISIIIIIIINCLGRNDQKVCYTLRRWGVIWCLHTSGVSCETCTNNRHGGEVRHGVTSGVSRKTSLNNAFARSKHQQQSAKLVVPERLVMWCQIEGFTRDIVSEDINLRHSFTFASYLRTSTNSFTFTLMLNNVSSTVNFQTKNL